MVTKTNMSSMPMFSTKRKREYDSNEEDRVYTCKTCNKDFSSFQALGGHRAAHNYYRVKNDANVAKKSHACLYCFQKFVSGQALGGHMRKHRDVMEEKAKPFSSKRIKSLDSFQEDERLQFSDSDLDLVLRIEPIRSMSPGSPSSVILDMESGNQNKSMQLVDSNSDRESDPVCKDVSVGEEWRSSYGLKVEYIDFFSKKYDQVEEVPVEIVPVLEDDDSLLELRMGS